MEVSRAFWVMARQMFIFSCIRRLPGAETPLKFLWLPRQDKEGAARSRQDQVFVAPSR
jgi:hypothetical protein